MPQRQAGAWNRPPLGDAAQRSQAVSPRDEAAAAQAGAGGDKAQASLQQKHEKRTGPNLYLQSQAEALHERPPRPVGELLAEVMDRLPPEDAAWLRERQDRYNRVPAETYAAVGARHFPAPPLREVER